jgi:RNA polymerase sigma factor (sigma-70 family)
LPSRKISRLTKPRRLGDREPFVKSGGEEIGQEIDFLVRRHGPRLERVVAGVLGDVSRAEDVCQDAWLSLWRRRDQHDLAAQVVWPLIRQIGVRKALDELRRRRRDPAAAGGVLEDEALALSSGSREIPADLEGALHRLATGERSALVLFFWEGLSVREIGALLEVPEGTVKTWMHRGRGHLRRMLEGVEERS